MQKLAAFLCLAAAIVTAQQKKSVPSPGAAGTATKICDDPYQVREPADGWPEGPVYIAFHREKSKTPWMRNPVIKAPGIEAASLAGARTLACVEESRLEMAKYESGALGYTPAWDVILVRTSDRKVYFMRTGFDGESPPEVKFHRGAGLGKPPVAPFVRWLRLVVDQKVARLKTRLQPKEHDKASALAFSADGSKLVMVQEPYDNAKPTPVTVFDLTSKQVTAVLHVDHPVHRVALSASGNMIATERYGSRVEIWDVSTAKMVHKLETPAGESLLFGADDVLATAGTDKVSVWNVQSERELRSAKGSHLALSPGGTWLVAARDGNGVTVQEIESSRSLATFPKVGAQEKYLISNGGNAMATTSVFSGRMYVAGNAEPQLLSLPAISMGMDVVSTVTAIAPTHDGFVFGNGDGFVGVASGSGKGQRVFATDFGAIKAIAVSPDEKLIAVADSSGEVSIWELL